MTGQTKFIKTALWPKDYPIVRDIKGRVLPEIAVVGRSNVGKSSLLNDLFRTKHLVKTSSVPGKTQALNFFNFEDRWAFADLPGYGYAEVPLKIKKQWGPMVQSYLEKREMLKLILFLIDIRRTPNKEDLQLLDWILYHQKAMILVLTKVDKVNRNERQENTKQILDTLDVEPIQWVHYSVKKNQGWRELMGMIGKAIKEQEA